MSYQFRDILIKGMLEEGRIKQEKDIAKEKRYRGGNAGILHHNLPTGSCARKAIARADGRVEEHSWNTDLMFEMGLLNETRWLSKLKAAGYEARSADDLVQTFTKKGTPVTGSPDIIIYKDGKPDFLVELKHMSSFWTFRDKVLEGKPSLEHLAQAGFYSMHLNDMPFCVLYTSSVKFSGPSFLTNLVPKPTDPGSENFEYTYYAFTGKIKTYKGKKIKEKKKLIVPGHLQGAYPNELFTSLGADFAEFKNTIPTIVQFDLRFDSEGYIEYNDKGTWKRSIVSKQNIMDFYNYVETAEQTKELPARPLVMTVDGETKGYSACDYSSLSSVCDKCENSSFDIWLKEAKLVTW